MGADMGIADFAFVSSNPQAGGGIPGAFAPKLIRVVSAVNGRHAVPNTGESTVRMELTISIWMLSFWAALLNSKSVTKSVPYDAGFMAFQRPAAVCCYPGDAERSW